MLLGDTQNDALKVGIVDDRVFANCGFDDLFGEEGADSLSSQDGVEGNNALERLATQMVHMACALGEETFCNSLFYYSKERWNKKRKNYKDKSAKCASTEWPRWERIHDVIVFFQVFDLIKTLLC